MLVTPEKIRAYAAMLPRKKETKEREIEMLRPLNHDNVLPVRKGHEAFQAESSPKMKPAIVLSARKGDVTFLNESGPPTMMEFFRMWAQE